MGLPSCQPLLLMCRSAGFYRNLFCTYFLVLFIILLLAAPIHEASSASSPLIRTKPRRIGRRMDLVARGLFKTNNSPTKIVTGIEEHCDEEDASLVNQRIRTKRTAGTSSTASITKPPQRLDRKGIFQLPDHLLFEIMEYAMEDYWTIRLTCRKFRDIFDEMSYQMASFHFPGGDKKVFKDFAKYQLIRVAQVGQRTKSRSLHFHPERPDQLHHRALIWLLYLWFRGSKCRGDFLLGYSVLLKMNIIKFEGRQLTSWREFVDAPTIVTALQRGLHTLTSMFCFLQPEMLIKFLGPRFKGLLAAIRSGSKSFPRYLVDFVSQSGSWPQVLSDGFYLDEVLDAAISVQDWSLLKSLYQHTLRRNNLRSSVIKILSERNPDPGALEVIRWLLKTTTFGCAHRAASIGCLTALQNLDTLGFLLSESQPDFEGETPVHTAAFFNRVDCLIFLVIRLKALTRRNYLNIPSYSQNLPLHSAVLNGSSAALQEIIRRFPHLETQSFFLSFRRHLFRMPRADPPLLMAIECGHFDCAQILLENFPQLISIRASNDQSTALHAAIKKSDHLCLQLLLRHAPTEIIKAVDKNGDTALHLAVRFGQLENIKILAGTHKFSGSERNNQNASPIDLLLTRPTKVHLREIILIFEQLGNYIE